MPGVPITCIVGTRGIRVLAAFLPANRPSDGMVSEAESCPHWFDDAVQLGVSHPFLPEGRDVTSVILDRIAQYDVEAVADQQRRPRGG